MRTYIPNTILYKKGVMTMKWLKRNINIFLIVALVVLLVGVCFNNLAFEKNTQEITVESGDTLWTLSQKHRGSISQYKWLQQVKSDNDIKGDLIVVGKTLLIPQSEKNKTNKLEIASDQ